MGTALERGEGGEFDVGGGGRYSETPKKRRVGEH